MVHSHADQAAGTTALAKFMTVPWLISHEGRKGTRRGSGMHPLDNKAHALFSKVIGAAIEVHRLKGPGLIESIYKKGLMRDYMKLLNLPLGLLINFHETLF
jgi:phosphoribosyl 1,2-cyclic phosphodiesterase